jgi:hypothetical protein
MPRRSALPAVKARLSVQSGGVDRGSTWTETQKGPRSPLRRSRAFWVCSVEIVSDNVLRLDGGDLVSVSAAHSHRAGCGDLERQLLHRVAGVIMGRPLMI